MPKTSLLNESTLYDLEAKIKYYETKLKQNFKDWRELERFSLLLKQKNRLLKGDFFYCQAETLFLQSYPQIERDKLLFEDINWIDYIEFYPNLKKAGFTKLRAIRRIYTNDIAQGKLGKYLFSKGKAELAIAFFSQKILNYPERNLFYLGYAKLLRQLTNLLETKPESLGDLSLNKSQLLLQRQFVNEIIVLKNKLTEDSFAPLGYQARYKSMLNQAEHESAIEVFKTKSLNPQKHPKLGQISSDNSAIVGKQGWFFINSGSNDLMEYHTGKKQLSAAKIDQWDKLLSQRITWHQTHKIDYQHIFIPNKIVVYPEYYPYSINVVNDRPIQQLKKRCRRSFLYPIELFAKQKRYYQLYEKQDCHWSFWGCYFTFNLICQSLGIIPNQDLLYFPIKALTKKGDLGDKFGLQEITLQKSLNFTSKIIDDNQVIKCCHQGSVRVLKNDNISHGKLIIFGDSFSNPGFPNYTGQKRHAARLSSLFAETLNEVHVVWTPWIDYDYIEQEKPDFVLTEMAERFLVRVPNDRDHLPLHEFAAMKIEQAKNRAKPQKTI